MLFCRQKEFIYLTVLFLVFNVINDVDGAHDEFVEYVKNITVPTQVIWGKHDHVSYNTQYSSILLPTIQLLTFYSVLSTV